MTARQRAEANESRQAGDAPISEHPINRPKSRVTVEGDKKASINHTDEPTQQLMGSIHSNTLSKGKKSGSIAVVGSKGNLKEDSTKPQSHQAQASM